MHSECFTFSSHYHGGGTCMLGLQVSCQMFNYSLHIQHCTEYFSLPRCKIYDTFNFVCVWMYACHPKLYRISLGWDSFQGLFFVFLGFFKYHFTEMGSSTPSFYTTRMLKIADFHTFKHNVYAALKYGQ